MRNACNKAELLCLMVGATGLMLSFSAYADQTTAAANGIQMLPPTGCVTGVQSFLAWDGQNPLGCLNGVTSPSSGSLSLGGGLGVAQNAIFNSNVGIGTSSPFASLQVDSSSYTSPLVLHNDSLGTGISLATYWPTVTFNGYQYVAPGATYPGDGRTTYSAGSGYVGMINMNPNTGDFEVVAAGNPGGAGKLASAQTAIMDMKQNGNIGIGTTSPNANLSVNNATGQGAIAINGASDSGRTYSALYLGNSQDNLNTDSWVLAHKNDSTTNSPDRFEIGYWLNNSMANYIDILTSGNVGIGTATPSGTLDVENSSGTAQLCLNGKCVTNLSGGTSAAVQQKLQTTVQQDVTSSLSGLSMSCGSGQMMTGISNGQPVCATPPTPTVTAASIVGGVYTQNLDGSCRYPNPNTGGCGCPSGQNALQIFDFDNSTCANGYYADGWRTSNCGIVSYLCLAN